MIANEIKKWLCTIGITLSRYMAYKADFLLTLIAPSLVFILVSYNVWSSVYSLQGARSIGGFSQEHMLAYQCWAFIATLLIRSHRSWNLSEDIRHGRITAFLMYPFAFWKFHACEFISFQCIQTVIATIAIGTLTACDFVTLPSFSTLFVGISFALLVSTLWFVFEFLFGLVAFWLEETWVFRYVFTLFSVFLSGFFIPLELFPQSVQVILRWTPFPFLTSVPVHIFLGTYEGSIVRATLTLCMWILGVGILTRWTWRRGLHLYTGAGI